MLESLSQNQTIELIQRLISWFLLVATFEFWSLRKFLSAEGPLSWSQLRGDFLRLPQVVLKSLDFLYRPRVFEGLIIVLLLLALLGLVFPQHMNSRVAVLRLGLWLLIMWRWRGAFNGGSDFMSLLILMVLVVALAFPEPSLIGQGAIYYLGLQVIYSYWMAGWSKVTVVEWRSGVALKGFLQTSQVLGRGAWGEQLPLAVAKILSWLVLGFELLFPLLLIHPQSRQLALLAAAAFHLTVYYLFGLNRFLWVWISGFPAIWYLSEKVFGI